MENEIKELLIENVFVDSNISELDPDDDLVEIGLDSLNCIQLIVLLEEKYDIEFCDNDLSVESVRSISQIINYILSHKKN